MPPRVARLTIAETVSVPRWDHAGLTSDGRLMLERWNFQQQPDDYERAGTRLELPYQPERKLRGCGNRFVWVGHGFGDASPAEVIVIDGDRRQRWTIPRPHARHVLDAWLDEATLFLILSDAFHVGEGVAVQEVSLHGAAANPGPVRSVARFEAHARLGAILRSGERLYALAGINRRAALLELVGESLAPQLVRWLDVHESVFTAEGTHVVGHKDHVVTIFSLDGAKQAQLDVTPPAGARMSLVAARASEVVMRAQRRVDLGRDLVVVRTAAASPRSRRARPSARGA